MTQKRLKFGAFMAPFHPTNDNPVLCLERDLELIEWLDKLGYDEVWLGEHHSGGWEISASPEIFIAAAAQRTRRIRFGTGVSSVPYHNIFMLADRLRQLEYLTHGRLMAGFGPGSLPADAYMQGINTAETRDILDDSMEYLVRLFRGETVTCDTKYCKLQDAMLQLEPYHESGSELFVASQVSPSGARLAGKYGLGMLSIGATSTGGFNSLASNWGIAEEVAKDYGNTVNRDQWRLVGPMHIAETREKAMENVRWGYHRWFDYFRNVAALPLAPDGVDPIQQMIDSGFAVIGTPEDAIEQIHRLLEQSGGFGSFLHLAVNWADWAETKKSYELFARYVIPEVNRMNDSRRASEKFLRDNNEKFKGQMQSAVKDSINKYAASKGDKFIHPDLRDHSSKP